ncbi:hypothetical protein ACFORO_32945 [Amycolatopsis halotolerans]|uniref:Uncharacterized protein n=1 Tax=Amycolatopsis halotolerans TaxID=330083 RepID=A0ABV7QSQ5_9PSEU
MSELIAQAAAELRDAVTPRAPTALALIGVVVGAIIAWRTFTSQNQANEKNLAALKAQLDLQRDDSRRQADLHSAQGEALALQVRQMTSQLEREQRFDAEAVRVIKHVIDNTDLKQSQLKVIVTNTSPRPIHDLDIVFSDGVTLHDCVIGDQQVGPGRQRSPDSQVGILTAETAVRYFSGYVDRSLASRLKFKITYRTRYSHWVDDMCIPEKIEPGVDPFAAHDSDGASTAS